MGKLMPPAGGETASANRAAGSSSGIAGLAVGVVLVAALYFGREVFIPLALAILLSFALGPAVIVLRHWHFNRVVAVLAVVGLAFLLISGIGGLVGSQLAHLAESLPQYQNNISHKVLSLRETTNGGGILGRAAKTLSDVGNEITKPNAAAIPAPSNGLSPLEPGTEPSGPLPVVIRQADPTPFQLFVQVMGPALGPLLTTSIVVVFVIFFLLQRQDLRDRFISLAGSGDLQRTTHALDDAARRLSRYLLSQTAVNASLGLLIGIGLWLIGVPNPAVWGLLTALLRFVPYIGTIIGLAFPAALAVAVDPGWSMLLSVVALYVVAESITGQVIEPWLYGHNTGLSPVAVVVAAAFWALLWGPIGLLLSTPLTMCLVVLGRHVERLQFLEILLGDRPALAPEERFYQRMLADDPDEAAHQAEAYLKEHTLAAYYDRVAIKGLALAQLDVNRGVLDHTRRAKIKEAVEWVIDDLADHVDTSTDAANYEGPGSIGSQLELAPAGRSSGGQTATILCIAGRGSLDEAAAAMLAQLLERHGFISRVVPSDAVTVTNLSSLDVAGVQIVCLSYLEPGSFANPRYLIRRLRRRLSQATIVDCFWTLTAEDAEERKALSATGADIVVTSLSRAMEAITKAARQAATTVDSASGGERSAVTAE